MTMLLKLLGRNLPTLLVGAVITLIIVLIVIKLLHDKKKGKNACGCNCANCPSAKICHTK